MDDLTKKIDDLIALYEEREDPPSDEELAMIDGLYKELKISKEKQKELQNKTMVEKLEEIAEATKQSKELPRDITKEITDALSKLVLPTPIVNVAASPAPIVNVPAPKVEVNVPKQPPFPKIQPPIVNIPDTVSIKKPNWLGGLINLTPILNKLTEIKNALVFPQVIFPTDPENPMAVRLSDGEKFYKAVGGMVNAIGSNFPFQDKNKNNKPATVNDDGSLNTVITKTTNIPIQAADSASIDAFGRWRVSNPQTLFDSKNIFDDDGLAADVENQPLFYDNAETSGSGTGTSYNANESSQTLTVSASTAGTRVRQTKMRFNYQPGKSQLIIMTFNINGCKSGITKREGVFDENNGLFLQGVGGAYSFVRRTKASGNVVDNAVAQNNWNIDRMDGTGKSGITLDFTKTQILFIDFEWLGVGRVRMGFVVDGKIYYAHEFNNANNLGVVYMSTPNLPLRSEIVNSGTGGADSLIQICSTVISEGGSEDLGMVRYASTAGTHLDANTENTIYALIGIRLKSEYIGATVKQLHTALQLHTASSKVEWVIKLNPTVAGVFTYNDQTNSAVQIALGATANTVTDGIDINGGFIESGGVTSGSAGSDSRGLANAIYLGSKIDGTVDTLVLCVRPIAGSTNVDIEGSLTWRELV